MAGREHKGPWVPLCRLDQLPVPGQARGFDLDGLGRDQVFVVCKAGGVHAYLNACPHWPMATLPWRKDAYLDTTGNYIMCHGHGARFSIEGGECVSGPCVGQHLTAVVILPLIYGHLSKRHWPARTALG
ncbi:MAG: hypothetical protein GAK30_01793 [Paracidovorax wautersii]|uniref:Rieske domain-containing protein n=1 Tax=Paracidovorax wautersii TaxID=1177982 RepID=A0A7V8FPD5_9BURK|nr:MAG: hypothetical protein GAK30_01793 [Paracidovorax wautersii]